MRRIIKRIRLSSDFSSKATELDDLLSVRKTGYDATVALAMLVDA